MRLPETQVRHVDLPVRRSPQNSAVKKLAGSRCIVARVSRGPRALRTKLNSCELDEDLEECALLWRASDAE